MEEGGSKLNLKDLSSSSSKNLSSDDDNHDDQIFDKKCNIQNTDTTCHLKKILLCKRKNNNDNEKEKNDNDVKINNETSPIIEKSTTITTTTTNTSTIKHIKSDDCEIVSSKKVDDKTYPVQTKKNTMNLPGRGYSPPPSEVEVIEYHDKKVTQRRDTIYITSSDDESSIRKINNKKTTHKQQAPKELENKPAKQDTSKIMLPPIIEHPSNDKNKGDKHDHSHLSKLPTNIPQVVKQQPFIPKELPVLSGVQTYNILATIENRPSTSSASGINNPVINNNNTIKTKSLESLINDMDESINKTLQMQWGNNDLTAINNKETSNLLPPTTSITAPVLKSHKTSTTTSKTTTTTATKNNYNPLIYTGTIPKQPVVPSTSGVRINNNNNNNNNEASGSDYLERQRQQLEQIKQQQIKQQKIQHQVQKQLEHRLQSKQKLQQQEPQQPPRTRDLLQQNLIQHQKNLLLNNAVDDYIDKNDSKVKKSEVIRIKEEHQQLPNNDVKKPCQEIYIKLRAMFPNIKSTYIKRFCPENWNKTQSHETQLSQIIENLLLREGEWEYDVSYLDDHDAEVDVLSVEKKQSCSKRFESIKQNDNCKTKTTTATTSITTKSKSALDWDTQHAFEIIQSFTIESVSHGLLGLGIKRGGFLYELESLGEKKEYKNSGDNTKKKTNDKIDHKKEIKISTTTTTTTAATTTATISLTPAAKAALNRDTQKVFEIIQSFTIESVSNGILSLGKKRRSFLNQLQSLGEKKEYINSGGNTDEKIHQKKEMKRKIVDTDTDLITKKKKTNSPLVINKFNETFRHHTDKNGKIIITKVISKDQSLMFNEQDEEQKIKQEVDGDRLQANISTNTFYLSNEPEEEEKKETNEVQLFTKK